MNDRRCQWDVACGCSRSAGTKSFQAWRTIQPAWKASHPLSGLVRPKPTGRSLPSVSSIGPPQGSGRAACMDSSPVVRPSNACSAPPSRSPRSGTFQKISPRFFLTSCVHPVSCKPSFGSAIGAGPVACLCAWSAFCLSAPVIGSLETASAGPDFWLNRHS